jgi:hypothetical protein
MADVIPINPYLSSRFAPDVSRCAFVVECKNRGAGDLLRLNPNWIEDEQAVEDEEDEAERATPLSEDQPSTWLYLPWQSQKTTYFFGTSRSNPAPHRPSDTKSYLLIVLPRAVKVSRRHFGMAVNEQGAWMVQNYSQYGTMVNGNFLPPSKSSPEKSRWSLTPAAPNSICAGRFAFIIHSIPHSSIPSSMAESSITPLLDIMGLDGQTSSSTIGASDSSHSTVKPTGPPADDYYYLEYNRLRARGPSKVMIAQHQQTGLFYVAKVYDQSQEVRARSQYEMLLSLQV